MPIVNLLNSYSLKEIFILIVFIALALKATVDFIDWLMKRLKTFFSKEQSITQEKEIINHRIQDLVRSDEDTYKKMNEIQEQLDSINKTLSLLTESDRDAIRAYIVEQHAIYCKNKKWIDSFTLDVIERRYAHYKAEGGNSYVTTLMQELRTLEKR